MLEPVDIRSVWSQIRPKLERLSLDCSCSWIPEDVYHACKSGQAHLWYADDAFVVLEDETDPYSGEKSLFIWIAVGDEGTPLKYLPQIEEMGRQLGVKKIAMESPREGFRYVGWRVATIRYEREVPQ